MEITLNDGTLVFMEKFSFYETYAVLLAGHPNAETNSLIIKSGMESLEKESGAFPYLIVPKIKMKEHSEERKKFFPEQINYPILPLFTLTGVLYHHKDFLKLPVMWMDELKDQMTFAEIFERSGLKDIDFMEHAERYEL